MDLGYNNGLLALDVSAGSFLTKGCDVVRSDTFRLQAATPSIHRQRYAPSASSAIPNTQLNENTL